MGTWEIVEVLKTKGSAFPNAVVEVGGKVEVLSVLSTCVYCRWWKSIVGPEVRVPATYVRVREVHMRGIFEVRLAPTPR